MGDGCLDLIKLYGRYGRYGSDAPLPHRAHARRHRTKPSSPIFPIFLPHCRLYEVVSLRMCVIPYKYRKIVEMLLKLMKVCFNNVFAGAQRCQV